MFIVSQCHIVTVSQCHIAIVWECHLVPGFVNYWVQCGLYLLFSGVVWRRDQDQIRAPICNYLDSHQNWARCAGLVGLVIVGGSLASWLAGRVTGRETKFEIITTSEGSEAVIWSFYDSWCGRHINYTNPHRTHQWQTQAEGVGVTTIQKSIW